MLSTYSINPGTDVADQKVTPPTAELPWERWLLAGVGFVVFFMSLSTGFHTDSIWQPAVGVGLVVVAWFGYWTLIILALTVLLQNVLGGSPVYRTVADPLLLPLQIGLTWWLYHTLARGSPQMEDPRSATIFLLLGPGVLSALFGAVEAGLLVSLGPPWQFTQLAGAAWISKALGILIVAPPLLVLATSWLVDRSWVKAAPPSTSMYVPMPSDWTWGEIIETTGLGLGVAIITLVLGVVHLSGETTNWPLWGLSWLLLAWTATRLGLRGGTLVAAASSAVALLAATFWEARAADFNPLQGNLLGQCSTALLVGASAGWLRASEARYRQVVGHIPVVLYSARLPRGLTIAPPAPPIPGQRRPNSKAELPGMILLQQSRITLVSPASQTILACSPELLLGPVERWLERIYPADRELVIAALTQLSLQKEPVTCEYRLDPGQAAPLTWANQTGDNSLAASLRWVRDTMAPHYNAENLLDGWEGVVEDISEARALSQNLRRTMAMLQGLVTHMPMGVFFVQGPIGQPILVNARARHLLGQREDLAAGLDHLPAVYRLHRPDGSPYPAEELPVAKALRGGQPCSANDIVVHRADGRRTALMTWAAPVDLTGLGKPEAAVWVLEDLTAFHSAEAVRKNSQQALEEEVRRSQRVELIGRLAGGVIHDFNNFLTVMMGLAALAQENLPLEHPVRADLERILEAGEQAAHLAGQVLAFGKPWVNPAAPIDLNQVANQALKLLKGLLKVNVDVKAQLADHPLWVVADETQLKQVVMNLLVNARDAMPTGGRLTIGTSQTSSTILLTVQDTGHGMDELVKARLFEPFFTTKERGTGLGLAVVNQIVTNLGGKIQVHSNKSEGTRMEVYLPAQK